jgi:hypothetical protein
MKMLDRYVIRTFLWSALMLLVALMALRIVTDLFLNMDEFMEDKSPFVETVARIREKVEENLCGCEFDSCWMRVGTLWGMT